MTKDILCSPLITELTATYKVSKHNARKEKALMLGKVAKMVLFFYAISLFQPMMPLVTDMIAHTINEKQHIMEVHEVSGKFHIHNDLAKSLHQSDKERSGEVNNDAPQYVNAEVYSFTAVTNTSYSDISSILVLYYPVSYQDIDAPPPQRG